MTNSPYLGITLVARRPEIKLGNQKNAQSDHQLITKKKSLGKKLLIGEGL